MGSGKPQLQNINCVHIYAGGAFTLHNYYLWEPKCVLALF